MAAALCLLASCGSGTGDASRVVVEATDEVDGFQGRVEHEPAGASPQTMGTGPILSWTEFDPGIGGAEAVTALRSIGDGRVVVGGRTSLGEPYWMITSNGTHWSELSLPAAIWLDSLDLSGERWVVSGRRHDNLPGAAGYERVYVSDDEGLSWFEATPQVEHLDLPEYVNAWPNVSAVAAVGTQVVAFVSAHFDFDLLAFLADQGRIPAAARSGGWSFLGDEVHIWLPPELSDGDTASRSAVSSSDDTLIFAVDDLELSPAQLAVLQGRGSYESTRAYSGSGAELVETAAFDGRLAGATGNDEGFVAFIDAGVQGVVVAASSDGEAWSSQTLDQQIAKGRPYTVAFESSGTAWMVTTDGLDSHLLSWAVGGVGVYSTRLGSFIGFEELSAGPAGLAMTAPPARGVDGPVMPVGRVAKDGYELRFGEPDGGILLWDVTAGIAVYEFEASDLVASVEPAPGVRQADDGEPFEVTFEDPDTGADLVTFTENDLEAVLGEQRDPPDSPFRNTRVGWSADGKSWGWQPARDAFGLGDAEAAVRVVVGENFVIASVVTFAPVESDASRLGGDSAVVHTGMAPRWFIARVP